MFGLVKKVLIRFARKVVEGVISQLMQQLDIVNEQALNPMRVIVDSITDEVWRGQGAEAFKEEVSSMMIPGVGKVANHINTMSSNIKFAIDVIDRADAEVNKKVLSLSDVFEAVF